MKGEVLDKDLSVMDFMSGSYLKMLLEAYYAGKKLDMFIPYVGVISYPSKDFLSVTQQYKKTTQFQSSAYIGYMEFLLPHAVAKVNSGCAYTLLQFTLDGKQRRYVQISNGTLQANGQTFKDFVMGMYPDANSDMAYNPYAVHVLTDIEMLGAVYNATNGGFVQASAGAGVFTPAIEFDISVSGYKAIML